MEETLQRPPDCWEIFRNTHRRKDGTFIDSRSQDIDDQMAEKFAHASHQDIEGGELQTPSHNEINQLYYEVVGGSKKKSIYGLCSHAKVAFDMSIPRLMGGASSSIVDGLRKENEELRQQFKALEETLEERVNVAVANRVNVAVQQMRAAVKEAANYFPTAIISGRSCDKVHEFVRLSELYYAGSHGMDIMEPVRVSKAIDDYCIKTTDSRMWHHSWVRMPASMEYDYVQLAHMTMKKLHFVATFVELFKFMLPIMANKKVHQCRRQWNMDRCRSGAD